MDWSDSLRLDFTWSTSLRNMTLEDQAVYRRQDIVVEFDSDPMAAWEFVDTHESFSLWQRMIIMVRLYLSRMGL